MSTYWGYVCESHDPRCRIALHNEYGDRRTINEGESR